MILQPIEASDHDNPAVRYLALLDASQREAETEILDTIAFALSNGAATLHTLPWSEVRGGHIAALRAVLVGEVPQEERMRYVEVLGAVLARARPRAEPIHPHQELAPPSPLDVLLEHPPSVLTIMKLLRLFT